MKITVIAVGKMKDGPLTSLFDTYAKRLRWKIELREIDIKKSNPAEQQEAECAQILSVVPPGTKLIVCDERGRTPTSVEFARQIEQWQSDQIIFAIGGADGMNDAVRQRADLLLSFGRLTWPHQLARVMLVEQIYRAQTILDNHPYHRA